MTDSEGSRDYITKAVDMPDLSPTLITYLFKLNVASSPLLKDVDNIKKMFNWLAFLPPPLKSSAYDEAVRSSKKVELEAVLDEAKEKRSGKVQEVFIKGRQLTLQDYISFLSNIVIFLNFFVDFQLLDMRTMPLLVNMLVSFSDKVVTRDFQIYF